MTYTEQATEPGTDRRVDFGRFGEQCAAEWYLSHGFDVLDRNWRTRHGEVDLVVGRGSLVVFVEVKARRNARFGTGFDAVDRRKQAKVRAVARAWLAHRPRRFYDDVRFDVVDVDPRGTVRVDEGCF
jgi:putative endonuclease